MALSGQPIPPRSLPCPDCGRYLVLRRGSRFGLYWGCVDFPRCQATHGAHQRTGMPLGTPGDRLTRGARKAAHQFFDPMWQSGQMSRVAAYEWMRRVLGVPRERAHISRLTQAECETLIEICKAMGLGPTEIRSTE